MEEPKNPETMLKEVSEKLLQSKYLIEAVYQLVESGNASEIAILTINRIASENIISAFNSIENYRKSIVFAD